MVVVNLLKIKKMKSIKLYFISAILLFGLFSCENNAIEFDDYDKSACYFPIQFPARTLVLGDYELGINDNDNKHQFEIGATLAGIYTNKMERKFSFEVDLSLLSKVTNVQALPQSYYTIETASPVSIPAGEIKGRIMIKLTDAFFNDPKAIAALNTVNYVIPLRMTSVVNVDTILSGKASIVNPILVNSADWAVQPKNYVLYGIKFINKYDASYLRRGVDRVIENSTSVVYHNQYIDRDEVVPVATTALKSVTLSNSIRRLAQATPGNINLKLVFDDNDMITIYNADSNVQIGTGQFKDDSEHGIWNKKAHDVIFLDYTYLEPTKNETHHVSDTLVYRNRNVKYEEFKVVVVK